MSQTEDTLAAVLERMQSVVLDPERQAQAAEFEARQEAEREVYEQARLRQARSEALEGLPLTEADMRLLVSGNLKPTRSLQSVRRWLEGGKAPVMVLCGSVGRGKTIAAGWLLCQRRGRYEGARALQRLFRADFGEQLEQQDQVLRCGTLVVDDLGREDDAVRMCSVLLDLVDWRRRSSHRTLLISNLRKPEFLKRYSDPRLLSRLRECAAWVQDAGDDMRGIDA